MLTATHQKRTRPWRARTTIAVLTVAVAAAGVTSCRRQPRTPRTTTTVPATTVPATTATTTPGPTSTQPPASGDVTALVRERLDASVGAGRYELLLVLSDDTSAASLHRTTGAGATEVLTTYRLAGGSLTDARTYRTTQRLGSGPVTQTYASAGDADPATEAANREMVLTMYREVIDQRQPDAPARYMTEEYIQHNPIIPSGRAAIEQFIRRLGPAAPGSSNRREELVIADGDFVLMVSVNGLSRIVDLFRVENGKAGEHWDFTPA